MNQNIEYVAKKFPYTTLMTTEFYKHKHSFWEFVICVSGSSIHTVNDEKFQISAGQLLIMKPDNTHDYQISSGSNYAHYDFYTSSIDMRNACDHLAINNFEKIIKDPDPIILNLDEGTLMMFENQMAKLNSLQLNSAFEKIASIVYNSLLHIICGLIIEDLEQKNQDIPDWLATLLSNMSKPEIISGSIEDVVSLSNFSHGHLCKLFKKYMNETLVSYFTRLKLDYSTTLLKNKNLDILDVASNLGYESVSHYISVFKKYYGITPKKYRKSIM